MNLSRSPFLSLTSCGEFSVTFSKQSRALKAVCKCRGARTGNAIHKVRVVSTRYKADFSTALQALTPLRQRFFVSSAIYSAYHCFARASKRTRIVLLKQAH
jgi:hypothetical protein